MSRYYYKRLCLSTKLTIYAYYQTLSVYLLSGTQGIHREIVTI